MGWKKIGQAILASGKMSAPPWRIGLCGDATRAPSAGPYGTGGVFRRRLLSFTNSAQRLPDNINPTPLLAAPMRQISGVRGQSPCHHHRQRSCPCILFGGPVANPALRRVGLGHLAGGDSPRGPPRNGCRSADSPDGGGRRGFALFCLATDGLTLLPTAVRPNLDSARCSY